MQPLNTPVVLIVFNRPETTAKTFEQIRKVKPKKLFIIADGPRPHVGGEVERCIAARAVEKQVDWTCELEMLYSDTNLGTRRRVSSGLTWVFSQVEDAIILEDDLIPEITFFNFCEVLLEKYRYDTRVMHIGGVNVQNGQRRGTGSYYFSKYPTNWGWATWRRAWKYFDVNMETLPAFTEKKLIHGILPRSRAKKKWLDEFWLVYREKIPAWDYQWVYTNWCQNALAITPNVNLVSNIGFGDDATNTKDTASEFAFMETEPLNEIIHPEFVLQDFEADSYYDKKFLKVYHGSWFIHKGHGLVKRVRRLLSHLLI